MIRRLRYYLRFRPFGGSRYLSVKSKICNKSKIEGPCSISRDCNIKNSSLGRYTCLSRSSNIMNASVGRFVSIGPECMIGGLGSHPTDQYSTSPFTYSINNVVSKAIGSTGFNLNIIENEQVIIGHDVWLGARCIILDGVKIGIGAIIGANTIIAKNVPPYAICYGSPPTIVRYRFDEEIISELLKSQWWNNELGEIKTEDLLNISNK